MPLFQISLACVAAISLATPASAQWGQDRTYSRQLRTQIDNGVTQGRISPPQTAKLRARLGRLEQLERSFMPNGISGSEYAVLFQRSAALGKEIRIASSGRSRGGDKPALTWLSRSVDGQWVPDARFAGLHPGDQFMGDAKIGQHVTSRIVGMPVQYRRDYVDTYQIYYGYDVGRVYQIDRKTRVILALLDVLGW